ncbi:MAG: pitrilysin family protein [Robiginitomaculum sp.]
MKKTLFLLLTASTLVISACTKKNNDTVIKPNVVAVQSESLSAQIDVPYTKTVLDNGLTVIVHEDDKAPLVSVNIWYNVGSRDEKKGKTGYAHLFEHLMFNGSEHADYDYFEQLNTMGATGFNGTTDPDKTNYFETVPKSSLERLLWLEADRMGYLLGALTQKKLDEQRGVVKNEKRQGDNKPYAKGEYRRLAALLPEGHPYRWSTIGSMEDLNNASIGDLTKWFNEYYGATNAVLVLAGDVTADEGLALAKKYFGHIRPGPPVSRLNEWVPKRTENIFDHTIDEVSLPLLERTWAVPGMLNEKFGSLYVMAGILGDGKTSRMYEELVEKRDIASEVYVQYQPLGLMGFFNVTVMMKPDTDPQEVNAAIEDVMEDFFRDGPSAKEIERVSKSIIVGFMKSQEVIGGFSGKGPTLAEGEIFYGDPAAYKKTMALIENTSAKDIQALKGEVFNTGFYQLLTMPNGKYKQAEPSVDLNKIPNLGSFPQSRFPDIQTANLSNGMKVALVERDTIPMVRMTMQFDAGAATDMLGKSGLASLTIGMMKEGTKTSSGKDIIFKMDDLGSNLNAFSGQDSSSIMISTLKENLGASLDVFSDILKNPSFKEDALIKLKDERLSQLTQTLGNANAKLSYFMSEVLFGKEHPYGRYYLGIGTKESIESIGVDDLKSHYKKWIRPDNATFLVVGDITLDQLMPILEKKIGSWHHADTALEKKNIPVQTVRVSTPKIYLMNKPGAAQTLISAAIIVPKNVAAHEADLNVMNRILGGSFLSRINMKLREEKGWSYGASTSLDTKKEAVVWELSAPVQTDKTKEALIEIRKIFKDYLGSQPASAVEIQTALDGLVNSVPGTLERSSSILGIMGQNQSNGKPLSYFSKLQDDYGQIEANNVRNIAKETIILDNLTWFIAGDLEKIKVGIEELYMGEIIYIED